MRCCMVNPSTKNKIYSGRFQKLVTKDGQNSAAVIIPILIDLIHPKSVVDVGCDTGAWLKECIYLGIKDVVGVDGPWIKSKLLLIPPNKFITSDLAKPFSLKRKFDMALCLEVAEHLPSSSSSVLVKSLVKLSPIVVFSAAIPGQGGTNHINEQWLEYWEKLFNKHNYVLVDAIRPILWEKKDVECWYAQNMTLFVKKNTLSQYKKLLHLYYKLPLWQYHLVHPTLLHRMNAKIKDLQKKIDTPLSTSQSMAAFKKAIKIKLRRMFI